MTYETFFAIDDHRKDVENRRSAMLSLVTKLTVVKGVNFLLDCHRASMSEDKGNTPIKYRLYKQ